MTKKQIRRLQLDGVYNIRDLGGYPISENRMTNWGVFFRSADLASITANDMDLLYEHGIRTIINIKAIDETENPIGNDNRFNHIQVPLIDDFSKMFQIIKDYNGNFYLTMIEAFQEGIKNIFEEFSKNIDTGGMLFHCLSGKDRTGIIAALLLTICGVSELDIISDYVASAIYLRPEADKNNKPYDEILKYPDGIEFFMKTMNEKYNGAEKYLLGIGVTQNTIDVIKAKFITKRL